MKVSLAFGAAETFSLLEANTWGMLFFASQIEERTDIIKGIHLNRFLGNLLAFTKYTAQVLSRLRYTGPLRADIRLDGMRGVKWQHFTRGAFPEDGPCSELDDTIQFSSETDTDALINGPDALAL